MALPSLFVGAIRILISEDIFLKSTTRRNVKVRTICIVNHQHLFRVIQDYTQ